MLATKYYLFCVIHCDKYITWLILFDTHTHKNNHLWEVLSHFMHQKTETPAYTATSRIRDQIWASLVPWILALKSVSTTS